MLEDGANLLKIAPGDALDAPAAFVEPQIRQCVDDWIEAVNSGYAETIGALYTPGAVLLPTFDSRVLTTPASRLQYFVNFKTRRGLKASVDQIHIEELGNNSGVASGLYTFRFIGDDGADQTTKARFTFVFARQPEGDWLITAHHSSVAPQS